MVEQREETSRMVWPARWWWIALAAIMVVAGALRYTGYNFSLPYVDHSDEPNQVIAAKLRLETGSAFEIGYHAYPPGHPTLSYFLMRWFHDPSDLPTTMIGPLRVIAIVVSLLLVVAIALLVSEVASTLAGLLAALLWAVSSNAVEFSRFAMPDIYLAFFTVLAVYLTLVGTRHDRDGWTTAGAIASMLAVTFKYQGVFVLPVIALTPLWRLRRSDIDKKRVWQNFIWNAVYYAVFFFWLLGIYPALEANTIPYYTGSTSKLHVPNLTEIAGNLWTALTPLRDGWAGLPALAGLIWLWWEPVRRRVDGLSIGVVILAPLLWWLLISFFGLTSLRQLLGLAALLTVLAGVGLSLWIAAIEETIARTSRQFPTWSSSVAIGVLVVGAGLPAFIGSVGDAHQHTLPDRRNDLADWADRTLASGRYFGSTDFHKVFNPNWGGYTGQTYFEYAEEGTLDTLSIDEARAADIEYAVVPYADLEVAGQMPESQSLLKQMTLLKTYPTDRHHYRDPGIAVYWLHPIEQMLDGQLGPIHMVGANLSATEVAPGETITFRLFWQANSPADGAYRVYNHLTALDDRQPLAQVDSPPLPTERRTTAEWSDPDETIMSRQFELTLPPDIAPGQYRLLTGFYQPESGQRLTAPDGSDFVLVTTITISE